MKKSLVKIDFIKNELSIRKSKNVFSSLIYLII